MVLQFVTGNERPPLTGFQALEHPFTVQVRARARTAGLGIGVSGGGAWRPRSHAFFPMEIRKGSRYVRWMGAFVRPTGSKGFTVSRAVGNAMVANAADLIVPLDCSSVARGEENDGAGEQVGEHLRGGGLPQAHVCFNQLVLPPSPSLQVRTPQHTPPRSVPPPLFLRPATKRRGRGRKVRWLRPFDGRKGGGGREVLTAGGGRTCGQSC